MNNNLSLLFRFYFAHAFLLLFMYSLPSQASAQSLTDASRFSKGPYFDSDHDEVELLLLKFDKFNSYNSRSSAESTQKPDTGKNLTEKQEHQLLDSLLQYHDSGQYQRVKSQLMQSVARAKTLNQEKRTFALMALASGYFQSGNFLSSARMCTLVTHEVQLWSQSPEVRKFARMCAFSLLKSALIWGNRFELKRDFSHFVIQAGFAAEQWHPTAVRELLDATLFVSAGKEKVFSPWKAVVSESEKLESNLEGNSESMSETIASGLLLKACVEALRSQPGNALALVAESSKRLSRGVTKQRERSLFLAAMSDWLNGRLLYDMGRRNQALPSFERASEGMLDLMVAENFSVKANQKVVGLFARLQLDSVSALEDANDPERALSLLGKLRDRLAILLNAQSRQGHHFEWTNHLSLEIELESMHIQSSRLLVSSVSEIDSFESRSKAVFDKLMADLLILKKIQNGSLPQAETGSFDSEIAFMNSLDSKVSERLGSVLRKHKQMRAIAERYGVRDLSLSATTRALLELEKALWQTKSFQSNWAHFDATVLSLYQNMQASGGGVNTLVWMGAAERQFDQTKQRLLDVLQGARVRLPDADPAYTLAENARGELISHSQAFSIDSDHSLEVSRILNEPTVWLRKFDLSYQGLLHLNAMQKERSDHDISLNDFRSLLKRASRVTIDGLALSAHFVTEKTVKNSFYNLARLSALVVNRARDSMTIEAFEEFSGRVFLCLTDLKNLTGMIERSRQLHESQSTSMRSEQERALESYTQALNSLEDVAKALERLVERDKDSLVSQIEKVINQRQNRVMKSLLYAYSAGVITQEVLNRRLSSLEELLKETGTVMRLSLSDGLASSLNKKAIQ